MNYVVLEKVLLTYPFNAELRDNIRQYAWSQRFLAYYPRPSVKSADTTGYG
jgi:hypothetical protein